MQLDLFMSKKVHVKRNPVRERKIQEKVQMRELCDTWLAELVGLDCGAGVVSFATMFCVGRGSGVSSVCFPSLPEPSITWRPIEGTPFTTTKTKAGPGAMMAGLGGSWLT